MCLRSEPLTQVSLFPAEHPSPTRGEGAAPFCRFVVLSLQRPRLSRSRLSCGRILSQPSSRSNWAMASAFGSARSCGSRAMSRTQGSSAGAACAGTCGGGFGAALAGVAAAGPLRPAPSSAVRGRSLEQALHLRAQPWAAEPRWRLAISSGAGLDGAAPAVRRDAGIAGLQRACGGGGGRQDHAGWRRRWQRARRGGGLQPGARAGQLLQAWGLAGAGAAAGSTFFATAPGATRAIVEPPSEP